MPPKPKLHKDKGRLKTIPKKIQNTTSSEPATSTSQDVENQQQFEVELVWCIQQLQSALNAGKLNQKQIQENTKTLNTLMSNSTPVIRKRQLMRLSFGDYRTKMIEEERRFLNVNRKIVLQPGVPSKKSMFFKKAPFLTSQNDFKLDFKVAEDLSKINLDTNDTEPIVNEVSEPKPENIEQKFQYQASNNIFRFNFAEEKGD